MEHPISNTWDLDKLIYSEKKLIASIQSDYLDAETCSAVVTALVENCDPQFDRELKRLRDESQPLILFSLRTENRSWPNQVQGYHTLAKSIKKDFPGASFLLHGISRGVSMGSTTSLMSLEEEVLYANEMKNLFEGSGLQLLSSVGRPLNEAVAISFYCDAFVAPMGSGMAIYKWLTNKPGIAFSNRTALDKNNPAGSGIRVFDGHRENIIQSHYLPLEVVTDLEQTRHGIEHRANFSLDEDLFYRSVKSFLLSL